MPHCARLGKQFRLVRYSLMFDDSEHLAVVSRAIAVDSTSKCPMEITGSIPFRRGYMLVRQRIA